MWSDDFETSLLLAHWPSMDVGMGDSANADFRLASSAIEGDALFMLWIGEAPMIDKTIIQMTYTEFLEQKRVWQESGRESARNLEREACIEDIQDAIGAWGGPEREHYTQAMHRCINAIENRAKGLDLWGRPLEAALGASATDSSLPPQDGQRFELAHQVATARLEEATNWHQYGTGHDDDSWCCKREQELRDELMALESAFPNVAVAMQQPTSQGLQAETGAAAMQSEEWSDGFTAGQESERLKHSDPMEWLTEAFNTYKVMLKALYEYRRVQAAREPGPAPADQDFTLPELNTSALSAGIASPFWNKLEKQLATELLKFMRGPAPRRYETVWIVEQDRRVHSVHATREHAEKEKGNRLKYPETPWAVLGSEDVPAMGPAPSEAQTGSGKQ